MTEETFKTFSMNPKDYAPSGWEKLRSVPKRGDIDGGGPLVILRGTSDRGDWEECHWWERYEGGEGWCGLSPGKIPTHWREARRKATPQTNGSA